MSKNNQKQQAFLMETDVWLPHPRSKVFEFFKHAENLQIMTPDWLNFKILTPLPITMAEGMVIDYALGLYGIRFHWQTQIVSWQPPSQFVDTQLKGPYRSWVHTHIFAEKDGGTLMRDLVEYQPPGGLMAPLLDRLFVARQVEKIFAYRKTQILKHFH
jgi:ligand-binding SRPBCC domain-containing protein